MTVACFEDDRNSQKSTSVDKKDVRIDTFRASGAGGQHRNKTDSGVRLTHLPTGIVVTATEERSQHQNRTVAWSRLRERLFSDSFALAKETENKKRTRSFDKEDVWSWTEWRDEVKSPLGYKTSMKNVLRGRLELLS